MTIYFLPSPNGKKKQMASNIADVIFILPSMQFLQFSNIIRSYRIPYFIKLFL